MRILVLGGSGFIGRHIVGAGREQGHDLTVFNRGRTPLLWEDVEQLIGDRDAGEFAALDTADAWDACVDVNAYVPQAVEATTALFRKRVDRYCFISTCSVYRSPEEASPEVGPIDEESPLYESPREPSGGREPGLYGPLKVACEQIAQAAYGDRSLIIRPGIVAGPYDPTNRFAWWVARLARGGETLAPGDPQGPVMTIDGRDLGGFVISALERELGGAFNVCGDQIAFSTFLAGVQAGTESSARLHWIDEPSLLAAGVEPFDEIPLWLPETPEHRAFYSLANARARAAGLTLRPLASTARDTLAWLRAVEAGDVSPAVPTGYVARGLAAERERALLAAD